MEIEIYTVTSTWLAHVDDSEFADQEPGTAAKSLRERINAGEPIQVDADVGAPGPSRVQHMVIFNPGHVVAVVEKGVRRGGWR